MTWDSAQVRLRVAVIIGSTREGRVGGDVGRWFVDRAKQRDDLDLDVIDLADFDFPARYPQEPTGAMTEFTGRIGRADGFVVVTPEYNRGYPAALKQAIDYAYDEWHAKPVGFVSYGCHSKGTYAVEQLRTVFTELHTVTLRGCVGIDLMDIGHRCPASDEKSGNRESTYPEGPLLAADALLDQLVWWGLALRDARAARPYVS